MNQVSLGYKESGRIESRTIVARRNIKLKMKKISKQKNIKSSI